MSVGGIQVATWIIITDAKITFSGNGTSFSEKIHDDEDFAPDHGIAVRDVLTTTGTDPSGQQSSEKTTRELKSLTPRR